MRSRLKTIDSINLFYKDLKSPCNLNNLFLSTHHKIDKKEHRPEKDARKFTAVKMKRY